MYDAFACAHPCCDATNAAAAVITPSCSITSGLLTRRACSSSSSSSTDSHSTSGYWRFVRGPFWLRLRGAGRGPARGEQTGRRHELRAACTILAPALHAPGRAGEAMAALGRIIYKTARLAYVEMRRKLLEPGDTAACRRTELQSQRWRIAIAFWVYTEIRKA